MHRKSGAAVPALTIRNLPEETHQALRVRAAEHGRSTEAEIRDILEKAAKPEGRIKAASLLAAIGRDAGLNDKDVQAIQQHRDDTQVAPMTFE
jgi:plasmid stability protein